MTDPGDPPPPPEAPAAAAQAEPPTEPLADPPGAAGPPDPPAGPPGAPPRDPSGAPSAPAEGGGSGRSAGPRRGPVLARSSDRYVGGVAGGLAQALDVDPIVVRVALVVGTLYVPVLVLAYALAWLVLPDERTGATLLGAARSPDGWRPVVGIAGLAVGAALLAPDLGPGGNGALTAGAVLAGLGVLLILRQPGTEPAAAPPEPSEDDRVGEGPAPLDDVSSDDLVDDHTPSAAPRTGAPLERLLRQRLDRRRRPDRPPSHLGWLGLSALVVLVGVVAAVDRGIRPVAPGVAVSLALLLVGGLLVVAAWRGRARLLILPGLVLLPLWVGWSLPDVPRYEHDGDVSYVVASRDELRRSYEHGFGQMDVDLRTVDLRPGEHRTVRVGLTAGQARLHVPRAAHLVIRGDVGLGHVEVWDGPYFGRVAYSGKAVAGDVDLRLDDPQPLCTEQPMYGPEVYDEMGNFVRNEVIGQQMLTPWGEPCEPEPAVDDPPVLDIRLDVGIGVVEVQRATA